MASFSISDRYQHNKSNDNTRYKSNGEHQHQLTCKQELKIYEILKDNSSMCDPMSVYYLRKKRVRKVLKTVEKREERRNK